MPDSIKCLPETTIKNAALKIEEGTSYMKRVKYAEEQMIKRDVEIAAYTKENRSLKEANESLQAENDLLKKQINDYRLSTNSQNRTIHLLQDNNRILESRATKRWSLGPDIGVGMTYANKTLSPGYYAGFSLHYSLVKF